MRLLNWNIQHGGGPRVERIVNKIASVAPDLCVLTEYRNNDKGDEITRRLADLGLVRKAVSATADLQKNVVALFSRLELAIEASIHIPVELAPYVIARRFGDHVVIGTFCATPEVGRAFVGFLSQIPKVTRASSILATGDFYFGETGSNRRVYNDLLPLHSAGWSDVWRDLHGLEVVWCCLSKGGRARPDHIFIAGSNRPVATNVEYLHDDPLISDHLPMVAEFKNVGWPEP